MNPDLPLNLVLKLKETLTFSLQRLQSTSFKRGIYYLQKSERIIKILENLQKLNKFDPKQFNLLYDEIHSLNLSIESFLLENRENFRQEIIQLEIKKDLRHFLLSGEFHES